MNIGDKVVCVDDSPCKTCGSPLALSKNQIYVVIGIRKSNITTQILLDIIGSKPTCHQSPNPGYLANRFRPLNEIKTANKQQQAQVA